MAIHKKNLSLKELPSVRQLRAFVAIHETGSLSGAAQRLALTQPAVSLLLRELEAKLGVRLFDRTTRAVLPTEAAAEAYAHAMRVLGDLQDMTQSLSGLAMGTRGRIRVAATSTLAQTLLPPVVREFADQWPGVRVEVDDCSPGEFVELITGGRVTFGVGTLEAPLPHIEERVFFEDPLVAVGLTGAVFSSSRPLRWKQLVAWPLVVVKPGYGVRASIDRAAQGAGVALDIAYEVALLSTSLAMAAAGLGVAVVPASVLLHTPYATLTARRLVDPVVTRNTAILHERGRSLSTADSSFIALLTQSSRRQTRPWGH